MLRVLRSRHYPIAELLPFASERSARFGAAAASSGPEAVRVYDRAAAVACDIVLLAAPAEFAAAEARGLTAAGALVVDNSSAFRLAPDVPLIVPEVNGEALGTARLVANPNCTTALMAIALWPIHIEFGLKRVIASTYQAASGAGAPGIDELLEQIRAAASGATASSPRVFPRHLALNVIPHIDRHEPNGYTREEMKVVRETRKIFGLPTLAVSCTAVRVPTLRAHAVAVTLETESPLTADAVRSILGRAPGLELVDGSGGTTYPTPLGATGSYSVQVGRIRVNPVFGRTGVDLFLCGDQLLKGAALNAVQIAELATLRG